MNRNQLRHGTLTAKAPPEYPLPGIEHSANTVYWTRYRRETGQIHVLVTKYDRADKTGLKRPDIWFRRW